MSLKVISSPIKAPLGFGSLFLAFVIACVYFIYQINLIFSAVALDGSCLYTFWQPSAVWWESPYWLVVFIVIGLLLWSAILGISSIFKHEVSGIVLGALAIVGLSAWLYGLAGMWAAMEVERGNISEEQFYEEGWVNWRMLDGPGKPCGKNN